jgi:hypothetical protein
VKTVLMKDVSYGVQELFDNTFNTMGCQRSKFMLFLLPLLCLH